MQASPTAQPTIISGRRGAGGRHKKSPLGAWPSGRGGSGGGWSKVTLVKPSRGASVLVNQSGTFRVNDKPDDNVIAPLNGAAETVMHGKSFQEKRGRRGGLPLGC